MSVSVVVGLLFSMEMIIFDMLNPTKVIGFLNITG
ncbi:MAG: hypothetical protein ACI892_001438, partial [Marinobacter maritimus]